MKKTVLFALPLVALMLAVACKKQEAAQTEQPAAAQVAGTAVEATPVAAPAVTPAPVATPAPAKAPVKKVK